MKYRIVLFFILIGFYSYSQPAWKCIYSDSAITIVSDTMIEKLATDMRAQNLPDEIVNAVVLKMKSEPVFKTRTRYVTANTDSTLIDMEVSEEGSLRLSSFATEYVLLKKDELYFQTKYGIYDSMITLPRKVFKPSGRQPVFFNHTCREYTSTDSTCTIWVAEELPSCINPGIRTGGIKGAVLFYELKSMAGVVIRCGITSMRKDEKK